MIDYSKYLNKTIRDIPLSPIEKISLMAAQTKDCILLGVGEPDFRTPWRIREAGIQALEKGKTWYSPGLGLKPLKQAICDYQRRRFKLDYSPEEVMVTVGGSEGIDMMFRVMLEEGDEVILLIVQQIGEMFTLCCGDWETVCDLLTDTDDIVILTVQFSDHSGGKGG